MLWAIGLVIGSRWSVVEARHAFFGKKVPGGRMMVDLVVGGPRAMGGKVNGHTDRYR